MKKVNNIILACCFLLLNNSCYKKQEKIYLAPITYSESSSDDYLECKNIPKSVTYQTNNIQHIEISDQMNGDINMDSLIETHKYVCLETTSESLLGNINKLCYDDGMLFVFDRENNIVLSFTENGKFCNKISQKGRGPMEYIELTDISINPYSKELCLLDLSGGKILTFDYQGNYKDGKPLFYYYGGLEFSKKHIYMSTGFTGNTRVPTIDCNRVIIANHSQEPLFKAFPYKEELRYSFHWEDYRAIQSFDNNIYFHHSLSDTIWEIKDSLCVARFLIDFTKRGKLFKDEEWNTMTDEKYTKLKDNIRYFSGKYLISGSWLYASITNPNKMVTPLLYNFKTKQKKYGYFSSSNNNFYIQLLYNSLDFSLGKNRFVKVIQPFETKRYLQQLKKLGIKNQLSSTENKLFNKILKEEDNPVLLIIQFKEKEL